MSERKKRILSIPPSLGFTLLEVMIAISILAITVTMLFAFQSQNISLITESQFNTKATLLSGLKIAYLESGKEAIEDGEGEFDDFPEYSWKLEVNTPTPEDDQLLELLADEMNQVDLTISWGEERYTYTVRFFLTL